MGIIGAFIVELFEGLVMLFRASMGLFPIALELLLVGGFLFFLLSKFWWKPLQEKKAAEAAAAESGKNGPVPTGAGKNKK